MAKSTVFAPASRLSGMADEACEVRPAGNRERAFTRIDPNCNLLTQNILIILHDVIVVNNNLSILIRNDIPYWLISTYHQNCEDRFLVKSPWYQRLYTFSSPRNCIFFFYDGTIDEMGRTYNRPRKSHHKHSRQRQNKRR